MTKLQIYAWEPHILERVKDPIYMRDSGTEKENGYIDISELRIR